MSKHSSEVLLTEVTGVSSKDEKIVEQSSFGNPKQFFHQKAKFLGCHQEMATKKHDIRLCVDSRDYCDAFMARYIVLLDNAVYMPSEHIQKEKEYGIIWRSAFKKELQELVNKAYEKIVDEDGYDLSLDPFLVIHQMVKKDCIQAANFDMKTQADCLSVMMNNLELLEETIFQIKALLKVNMPEDFEKTKKETNIQTKFDQTNWEIKKAED